MTFGIICLRTLINYGFESQSGDVWPCWHFHSLGSVYRLIVRSTMIHVSCFIFGLMIDFVILVDFLISHDPRFMFLGVLGSLCGVFLQFYSCPWPGQYVIHRSVLIFYQLFLQLAIGQRVSLEGGDSYQDVTSGDVYIFLVEVCYVAMLGFLLLTNCGPSFLGSCCSRIVRQTDQLELQRSVLIH